MFVAIVIASFSATAYAQTDDAVELLRPVADALMTGKPLMAAALFLVFAASAARAYGGKRWPFLMTEAGGAALVLAGAFGGATASAMTGGAEPSLGLAWQALQIAVGASGGYSLIKQLVVKPLLHPLADKAPDWLQPAFAVVFWLFDKPLLASKAEQIKEAEAAGLRASAETPPQGTKAITGEPRDVD